MHVVTTAGHVDHGKSTLVRALTGMEPDRWEEERRRGLTVDLGFVWATLAGTDDRTATVAFVDVPGHHRFVSNMLAGVGAAPAAVFVVAADDGWKAQSHEHLAILDLLGVPGALVAITKSDRVDAARCDEVVADTRRRVVGTCLSDAPLVVVDAVSGRGLADLERTLVDRLERLPAPADHGSAHLWVDRVFSPTGVGTIVTGTLVDGHLAIGDPLLVLPAGHETRARGLQALGRDITTAAPGSRVAVNLAGVTSADVGRGDLVATPDPAPVVTSEVDVQVRVVDEHVLGHTGAWHAHVGTARVPVEVWPLLDEVRAGEQGHVRLQFDGCLPVRHGTRLVIRDAGRRTTVAGARVLDPTPGPRPRGTVERLARAEVLDVLATAATPDAVTAGLVASRGGKAPVGEVLAALGRTRAPEVDTVRSVGDQLVDVAHLADWRRAVTDAVAERGGRGLDLPRAEEAATGAGCPRALARSVVDDLVDDGILARHGPIVMTIDHESTWRARRAQQRAALVATVDDAGLQPPDPDDLVDVLELEPADLRRVVDDGDLVRAGPLLFAPRRVAAAVAILAEHYPDGAPFTASDAGSLWATTRKFTIPLLEHLARTGATWFDGQHHHLAADRVAERG